jgi:very-short-patch-repair endonuclease
MTLVSAFSHLDMDPGRSSAEGVKLLRLYLQYAASRGSNLGDAVLERPALNPFEIDVRDTLTRAGIPLTAQYGCSGYWIDFAAAHPQQPGRMVLAVECDGATYHSSATARDRDRLRQDQLEPLGWTFHRIWSQDWFADKERETAKARAAWQAAVARSDEPSQEVALSPSSVPVVRASNGTPQRRARPYVRRSDSIDGYSDSDIVRIVEWIGSDTLLRTEDELLAETMRELGFSKRGKKIVNRIQSAISDARRSAC